MNLSKWLELIFQPFSQSFCCCAPSGHYEPVWPILFVSFHIGIQICRLGIIHFYPVATLLTNKSFVPPLFHPLLNPVPEIGKWGFQCNNRHFCPITQITQLANQPLPTYSFQDYFIPHSIDIHDPINVLSVY